MGNSDARHFGDVADGDVGVVEDGGFVVDGLVGLGVAGFGELHLLHAVIGGPQAFEGVEAITIANPLPPNRLTFRNKNSISQLGQAFLRLKVTRLNLGP